MELQTIINGIFSLDKSSQIISLKNKYNKELCLAEVKSWVDTYLKDTFPENSVGTHLEDKRNGRVGNPSVYFSLDRSYGIVAINQEGLNVISACRFATIAATCGIYIGKWMYEVQLGSKGIMQIGWCSNKCVFSADRGCGDTTHSYAYDGSRNKSWNVISQPYGEHWKSGDIISICIDLNNGKIEFYRNGHSLGIAFDNISVGSGIIYIPCISLVDSESVSANFGARPFHYAIEGYEALQRIPQSKVDEAEIVLKWLKNLTNLIIPHQTPITNCEDSSDISDTKFWNRLYYIIMFHINNVICNKYCLFNNFVVQMYELANIRGKDNRQDMKKVHKILDEIWLYTKEGTMDKTLYALLSHLSNSFKQMSDSLNSEHKIKTLDTVWIFLSHEKTRKFVISHFLFDRIQLLPLLHHKPLDDYNMQNAIKNAWWNTKTLDTEIEKNKTSYLKSLQAIQKSSQNLENKQLSLLHLILNNTDGTENEPSSRRLFLHKFNKFCWHEWECSQNDLNTRLPSSVVYSGFLRLLSLLFDLWKTEIPKEELICPSKYFYDRTLKYKRCDRIGGIEQYLYNTFHTELVEEIGDVPEGNTTQDDISPLNVQLTTLAGGLQEIIRIVDGDAENNEESILPSTSSAPFLQALFAPLARETPEDIGYGNIENKKSLLAFFDNLIMLYSAVVSRHCKKISKVFTSFTQCATDYSDHLVTYRTLNAVRKEDDQLIENIRLSLDLLKAELEKKSRRIGWIKSVLLNEHTHGRLLKFFNALHSTISEAEKHGELFSFLPDFYLHAYGCLIQAFSKDLASARSIQELKGGTKLIADVSDLCVLMLSDSRIKHIDCKKVPINALAALATCSDTMKVLESLERKRCEELIQKLLQPYGERHWKGTNWILIRFWHGDGFGFRYTEFPHHNMNVSNYFPVNYIMYNIAPYPSRLFQELIRNELLNPKASVPKLLDSVITELHYIFGEFLTQMQELQRALERNEQLLMFGRLYKMCASYFNKSIALIRVLDLFITLAPEIFTESYYPESIALTKRIVQIILLIIHRITSKQGCFRTVMNSRIAVLENIDYLPIETACIAVVIGLLRKDIEAFNQSNIIVPFMSKIVLNDSSYSYENLQILIGTPEEKNATIMSLHNYDKNLTPEELAITRKLLELLTYYEPMLSAINLIPEDEMCIICCSAPIDVKFKPCDHTSCLSCITYYLSKNKNCFFCKREILQVVKISSGEAIEELNSIPENNLAQSSH